MQQPSGAGGRRQTAVVTCPKSMVGRVIGRNGETIKALQTYTGALIQIDQTCDPTKIAISGTPYSLNLALSMVHDIVRGTFKGFALLRQATGHSSRGSHQLSTKPVYAPGYGLIPPSQLYGGESAATLVHPAADAGAAGSSLGAPRAAGAAPAGAGAYPHLLTAGPLAAAPQQYVLGVQPVQVAGMTGSTVHAPVYNVIGGLGFSGPVYLSPAAIEYSSATASGSQPLNHLGGAAPGAGTEVVFYTDGSALLSAGATGSRLFRGSATAPGGGGSGLSGGAAATGGPHGLGSEVAEGGILAGQPLGAFRASGTAGAAHRGMTMGVAPGCQSAGGGGAPALLQPGSLVMDAEGAIYTYTIDG